MSSYKNWIVLCLLAAWVMLLRLPSLDEPLDNDSGANAYHARLILRGEPLYGSHHTGHHMPGVYYTYDLAFLLFGDQQFAPKWLLVPWTILICWILYFLGRQLSSELTGILSAGFYAVGTSQVMLKGMTAEMELFANLPITLAVALIILLLNRRSHSWLWLWVGALSAVSVIYKVIYLAPIAAAGLAVIFDFWGKRYLPGEDQKLTMRISWLSAGFIVPLLGVLLYFSSIGLLDRFLLIFQLGVKYVQEFSVHVTSLPLPPLVGFPIFWMAFNNFFLLLIGLVAALRLIRNKIKMKTPDFAIRAALLFWLLFSFIQAGVNRVGFAHYVLLIIPPLSFFAALEINRTYLLVAENSKRRKAMVLAGGMVGLVLLNSIATNYKIYVQDLFYRLGEETYEQSLSQRPGAGKLYLEIKPVAEYIQAHTNPNDLIYYWGIDAELYYLADRHASIEFIWPYYAAASPTLANIFAPATKYIILADAESQRRPDWLMDGIRQNYHYEITIQGREIYRRESTLKSP